MLPSESVEVLASKVTTNGALPLVGMAVNDAMGGWLGPVLAVPPVPPVPDVVVVVPLIPDEP